MSTKASSVYSVSNLKALVFNFFQPQNIVLMGSFPNCEIKLCDLEVSRVIKEDREFTEIIGTPDYVGK